MLGRLLPPRKTLQCFLIYPCTAGCATPPARPASTPQPTTTRPRRGHKRAPGGTHAPAYGSPTPCAHGLTVHETPGWQKPWQQHPQPQRRRLPPHRLSRRQRPPALGTVINGRPDLNGPLCNVLLARNGDCYIIAAGTANHAGTGGWRTSGNSSVLGIEAENNGVGEPWPAHQIDAYVRLCAAMCDGGGFTPTPSVTTASGHPPASLTLPVPVSHRVTSGAGGSRKPSPKETP